MDKKLPTPSPDDWTKPGAAKPPGSGTGKLVIPIKPVSKSLAGQPFLPLADAVSSGGTLGGETGHERGSGDVGRPAGKSFSTTENLSLNGIGDRMRHLAMSHSTPNDPMRQSQLAASKAPGKIRPMSKLECARSRGAKNFCDPAHPASCGGKFCGRPLSARSADDFV
jgi:hypothetical protein